MPMKSKTVEPPNINQAAICQLFIRYLFDSVKKGAAFKMH
jgi:hypothetical protein